MKWVSKDDVTSRSVRALGLDDQVIDLEAPEAIAALIRRSASYMCPCPPNALIVSVRELLTGLAYLENIEEVISETLEAIIAYGDLFQLSETSSDRPMGRNLLYLRPPTFVLRPSGMAFLLGIGKDDAMPKIENVSDKIEFLNHVRRLPARPGVSLKSVLKNVGFLELPEDAWLKLPRQQTAREHLNRLDGTLETRPPSGSVPGLYLLDPSTPVRFYPGRWRELRNQSGRFVARRPQAYGADLWCYAEVKNGQVLRILDFPLRSDYRGCDEAWRLQAAIDAIKGDPQFVRIYRETDHMILQFFSPLPMWARRRLDVAGEPLIMKGCLIAYRVPISEAETEKQFLTDMLWMSV